MYDSEHFEASSSNYNSCSGSCSNSRSMGSTNSGEVKVDRRKHLVTSASKSHLERTDHFKMEKVPVIIQAVWRISGFKCSSDANLDRVSRRLLEYCQ